MSTLAQNRIDVTPLGSAPGAEVRGIDMRQPLDETTQRELLEAWMQHLVLVLPGQHIGDKEHVDLTRCLGEPEIFHQIIIKSKSLREISRVSKVEDEGQLHRTTIVGAEPVLAV